MFLQESFEKVKYSHTKSLRFFHMGSLRSLRTHTGYDIQLFFLTVSKFSKFKDETIIKE